MAVTIDQEIAAAQQNVKQSQEAVQDYGQRRQQDDRSAIAKSIVYVFVGLIVLVVLITTMGTFRDGWDKWTDPAKFLLSLLSSVLLPVVTLVIGYYFGKEK